MPIQIGEKIIGEGKSVYIIAEIASAHGGDAKKCKQLVKAAYKSGADAVKFQKFKVEELMVPSHPQYKHFRELELPEEEWIDIIECAKQYKLHVLADVFDKQSADFMDEMGALAFKIHSTDLLNPELISHVAKKKKPVLLGTGGHTLEEIKQAIKETTAQGNEKIILVHGFQGYPTQLQDLNLRFLFTLKNNFGKEVGYHDHVDADGEYALVIPCLAIAMGASTIEKHITLNRQERGPDYYSALNPNEFKLMVQNIRNLEKALGTGEAIISPAEAEYREKVVKRIVAKRKISMGETIDISMITFKRAEKGLLPIEFHSIVGKKAKTTIMENEAITWEKLV